MLRDDVSNRADDGDAPDDLPERTAELVASLFGLTILDRVGHERVPATSIPLR